MARSTSLRGVAALLLLLATIVFVVGLNAERSLAGESSTVRPTAGTAATDVEESPQSSEEATESHDEGAEAGAAGETEGSETAEEADESHDEANEPSETVLGIDPESTGAVAAAVVISLLLAVALWFSSTPTVPIVVAVFALLFAALDLREVAHQAHSGLAAIALLAAALHVGVAVLSGLALTRHRAIVRTSTGA
jgi:hypothetical protein